MSETLKEVVEQEDERQIVAQEAHDDYYDSHSIIPADNVDADGVPWATVGENIRNGAKNVNIELAEKMYSAILGYDAEIAEVTLDLSVSPIITSDPRVTGGVNAVFIDNPFVLITAYSDKASESSPGNIYLVYGSSRKVYIQIRQGFSSNNDKLKLILALKK
jgi:hypothetical protein